MESTTTTSKAQVTIPKAVRWLLEGGQSLLACKTVLLELGWAMRGA